MSSTPVLDFVVATSDRRRELRGSRWDSLRQGTGSGFPLAPQVDRTRPYSRFEKGVSFAPHTAMAHDLPRPDSNAAPDAATRLTLLLRHAAWPLRWEPLNSCSQHRAVGTPGALFPVDLYLLAQTGDGPRALYCSPRDLCLLETGTPPPPVDEPAFVICGNLGRCVGIYGDLALWLVTLEAGMLAAQLQLVARRLGWQLNVEAGHDADALRTLLGLGHWSELPLLRVRLSGEGAVTATAQLSRTPLATVKPLPQHAAAERHPLMREFLAHCGPVMEDATAHQALPPVHNAPVGAEKTFPLMEVSARRSSGAGNGIARWIRDLDPDLLQALLADTRQLLRESSGAVPAAALSVSLAWRTSESGPVALFELDPAEARLTPLAPGAAVLALARGMCRYNDALLLTIGADGHLASEQRGGRPLLDAHLQAGALAQCLSLAATRHGLTARLFMAYPDALKNQLLPLHQRALLQILVGFDPQANPAFAIT